MISKELHEQLLQEWKGLPNEPTVYAKLKRLKLRIPHFEETMSVLAGTNLLEIGSNAGMHAYSVARICNTYTGLEPGTGYWRQSMCTLPHIPRDDCKSVEFINATIPKFIESHMEGREINALLFCFSLYHIPDNELALINKHILPNCRVVYVQNRNQPRYVKKNSYGFWKEKHVQHYFTKRGFTTRNVWFTHVKEGKKRKPFSEVICVRKSL